MKMSVGDFISKSVAFELKTCPNRVKKTVQHRILYDIRLLFDFVNVIILIESLYSCNKQREFTIIMNRIICIEWH